MSGGEHPAPPSRQPSTMPTAGAPPGMVWIPGGDFLSGASLVFGGVAVRVFRPLFNRG